MQHAFAIPLRGPLEHALKGMLPNSIEIGIAPSANSVMPLEGTRYETKGMGNTFIHVISPIYLIFFERYNDWLTAKYGDGINWPPTLNFARVVRNAVAHGKINIRNPGAPLVTWRGLSYGYPDRGKTIIGTDLLLGDVIGLMFDANAELDKLNAPVL